MRRLFILIIGITISSCLKGKNEVRGLLVDQLKNTHSEQEWFVPISKAVAGKEQVEWKDSTGNHSIMELVSHLIFWNEKPLKEQRCLSLMMKMKQLLQK